jgi:type IV secretory pathway TrbF-like protein
VSSDVVRIERLFPRTGAAEEPELTARGYRLGDPKYGSRKHHAENAVFVATLDAVAAKMADGFSVWMAARGKRASLISPGSLRVVRAGS